MARECIRLQDHASCPTYRYHPSRSYRSPRIRGIPAQLLLPARLEHTLHTTIAGQVKCIARREMRKRMVRAANQSSLGASQFASDPPPPNELKA